MSFESISGVAPILDIQFTNTGEPAGVGGQGADLVSVLAQLGAGAENSVMIVGSADNVLDESEGPSFVFYDSDPLGDGSVGGYIEIYEPVIHVPDGFVADDLYAVEFILNATTGELTINFLFSTDPLDHQISGSDLLNTGEDSTGFPMLGFGFGDIAAEQAGPVNGSRCTVTITKTTTQNSGSSSWTVKAGVGSYTSNSGSTITTTTTARSYEGTLINGRCMVRNGH